jgi:hypothetical protein
METWKRFPETITQRERYRENILQNNFLTIKYKIKIEI